MPSRWIESGRIPADIMVVGEAPGKNELLQGLPFVGAAGHLRDQLFLEAGVPLTDCFTTNVAHERPPDDDIETFFAGVKEAKALGLEKEMGLYPRDPIRVGLAHLRELIPRVRPKLIIALGGTALWALTGKTGQKSRSPTGIQKWRSSEMELEYEGGKAILVPTIHPAAVLHGGGEDRQLIVHDLRRAMRDYIQGYIPRPSWQFTLRPRYEVVMSFLRRACEQRRMGGAIVCDSETRGGHISCWGIALNRIEALCIPFMDSKAPDGHYWSPSEEYAIVLALRELLTIREGRLVFQFAVFDCGMSVMEWGHQPTVTDDTMIMQHVCFPGLLKRLEFLSSMYCHYHYYWKDDGKLWDSRIHTEEQHWYYNCEDCVRTYESFEVLDETITRMNMREQYVDQIEQLPLATEIMLRGMRVDHAYKKQISKDMGAKMAEILKFLALVLGHPINPRSNPQMRQLFEIDFGCKPRWDRKKKAYVADETTLKKWKAEKPLLRPLIEPIEEYRSLGVFKGTFADAEVSPSDQRLHCTVNLTGAETYRWSTSEYIDGTGTNLQNISKGTED